MGIAPIFMGKTRGGVVSRVLASKTFLNRERTISNDILASLFKIVVIPPVDRQ